MEQKKLQQEINKLTEIQAKINHVINLMHHENNDTVTASRAERSKISLGEIRDRSGELNAFCVQLYRKIDK